MFRTSHLSQNGLFDNGGCHAWSREYLLFRSTLNRFQFGYLHIMHFLPLGVAYTTSISHNHLKVYLEPAVAWEGHDYAKKKCYSITCNSFRHLPMKRARFFPQFRCNTRNTSVGIVSAIRGRIAYHVLLIIWEVLLTHKFSYLTKNYTYAMHTYLYSISNKGEIQNVSSNIVQQLLFYLIGLFERSTLYVLFNEFGTSMDNSFEQRIGIWSY